MKKYKITAFMLVIMIFLMLKQTVLIQGSADTEPEADLILFNRQTAEKSASVFTIEVGSHDTMRLTPDDYYAFSWSPDGLKYLPRIIIRMSGIHRN